MTLKFSEPLLDWYAEHARQLPWRGHPDPYLVWVSEVMLQQTRVETVIPYFNRWVTNFPTISDLAKAEQQDVLKIWEGLGYYGRARNLHKAAQLVMAEYGGELPRDIRSLKKLPGIGRYTAGAIASIAYGMDEPALDGNVSRVLARYFNLTEPIQSPEGKKALWSLATRNLPPGRAGEYNQALMDLGAMVCTPRDPKCVNCPLSLGCQAYRLGLQLERPVPVSKNPIPHVTVTAAVIKCGDRVLITKRPQNGLLGGMWEFPGGKQLPGEDLASCLQREIMEELAVEIQVGSEAGVYQHAYTHFRVTLYAFNCSLVNGREPQPEQVDDLCWVPINELDAYPMGKIDRQIAARLLKEDL